MAVSVPVSQLKSGEKIIQDIQTQRGNILLQKGKRISQRDIDILRAFLIQSVMVELQMDETGRPVEEIKASPVLKSSLLSFYTEYNKMLALIKQVFNLARSGGTLPILDIRTGLQSLISIIHHYNILTFSPRNRVANEYMYHNGIMVSLTSYLLAKWFNFAPKDLMPIAISGLLHDIGNAKIDPTMLNKPSKLTSAELDEVRRHTIYGYNILKPVPAINEGVKLVALQHHEREDGTGYPLSVKGSRIHMYAKVVAIADIFHAATSHRFYKMATSPYMVLEQISQESFGKLEPTLVQTFINKVTQFNNGTVVRLSDDSVGEIVFSDRMHPTRPWVSVNGKIINLTIERSLFIEEVVQS